MVMVLVWRKVHMLLHRHTHALHAAESSAAALHTWLLAHGGTYCAGNLAVPFPPSPTCCCSPLTPSFEFFILQAYKSAIARTPSLAIGASKLASWL